MVISSETVIKKMQGEIEKAIKTKNHDQMIDHISKIKLLSELILDENKSKQGTGEKELILKTQISKELPPNTTTVQDGTSIFDF